MLFWFIKILISIKLYRKYEKYYSKSLTYKSLFMEYVSYSKTILFIFYKIKKYKNKITNIINIKMSSWK